MLAAVAAVFIVGCGLPFIPSDAMARRETIAAMVERGELGNPQEIQESVRLPEGYSRYDLDRTRPDDDRRARGNVRRAHYPVIAAMPARPRVLSVYGVTKQRVFSVGHGCQ